MHPREWPNLIWRTCGQTLCLMFICIHVDIVKYMAINMFKLIKKAYKTKQNKTTTTTTTKEGKKKKKETLALTLNDRRQSFHVSHVYSLW